MSKSTGVVNIRGKEYQTVALRVQMFREQYPWPWRLVTSIVYRDEACVVMRAEVIDPDGELIATGHAEEYRKSSEINKTSALENCETSAIGRALACLGLGGTEFASADEVARAVSGAKGFPSPVKSASAELTDEQQKIAADVRLAILEFYERDAAGEDVRYEVFDLLETTDSDIKVGAWLAMAKESKQRNWAKKVQDEVRAELKLNKEAA